MVVCKTTGREEAGLPHWETVNPAPQDECWMKHKNALRLPLSPFYPGPDLTLPVTHKAPVVCACVERSVWESYRKRDLFKAALSKICM